MRGVWHIASSAAVVGFGLTVNSLFTPKTIVPVFPRTIVHADQAAADAQEIWEEEEEDNEATYQDMSHVSIFAGNGNSPLARKVARSLGIPLGKAIVSKFQDGECNIRVIDSVRGQDVYIIQPTSSPVNDHVMELLLMISTLKRASAGKVTAVIPYYGYSRQDRKREARETIGAADFAKLLESVGVDHVLAVDLHRGQIEGFFDTSVPVDNLDPRSSVLVPYIMKKDLYRPMIISPSETGISRALQFRQDLMNAGLDAGIGFVVPKDSSGSLITADVTHHHRVLQSDKVDLVGVVTGCDVILVDDMIDTGSRMCLAAETARKNGAHRVFGIATHGLFSGDEATLQKLQDSSMTQVIICDTIPSKEISKKYSKIKYVSVSNLIAEAITRVHKRKSLSTITERQA
jgi:ribose-phosphate pyrophosphokinase